MLKPDSVPTVPDEVQHLTETADFHDLHEDWQKLSLQDMLGAMPEPRATEYGDVVVLDPANSDKRDETHTLVLGLPFQQAWKPSMYVRAEYARQVVAPESRMVVLPNNSNGQRYYDFSKAELGRMKDGNLGPFFERHVRALEDLDIRGKVTLSGYSLGGLTAVGIAAVCSNNFEVSTVNADELPTGSRTPKELQKAFMSSGGWGEQRAAIADAKLPVLSRALNAGRLALDYAKFGLATLSPVNKALSAGMARGDFGELLERARANAPEANFKLGHVVGSQLFLPAEGSLEDFDIREYSGAGAHMHATGDNVVAHALMIVDAEQQR